MLCQPTDNLSLDDVAKLQETAVKGLEAEGHEVLYLIFADGEYSSFVDGKFYNRLPEFVDVIKAMCEVDGVVFLPGYISSDKKCKLHYDIAKAFGLFVRVLEDN
jgi:microcystin degradation protein MlrC